MARKAPIGEEPFRPLLDQSVISGVLSTALPKKEPIPVPALPSKVVVVKEKTPEVRVEANPPKPLVEKLDQEKRMLLTRAESIALERLVNALGVRLNVQLKLSHVLRSLVALVLHAEAEIDKRAGEAGSLTRPPNGDTKGIQRFETEIAKIIADALRDAGPLRI